MVSTTSRTLYRSPELSEISSSAYAMRHLLPLLIIGFVSNLCTCSRKYEIDTGSLTINSVKNVTCNNTTLIIDSMDQLCMPIGTDRLVYRYRNGSHIFVGFDVLKENLVYTMSWKFGTNIERLTAKQKGDFTIQPAAASRASLCIDDLLAATNHQQQMQFKRNVHSCPIVDLACVIQSLAACANKMKSVTIEKVCSPITTQ